jgi:RING-variant domain/FHA domain
VKFAVKEIKIKSEGTATPMEVEQQ